MLAAFLVLSHCQIYLLKKSPVCGKRALIFGERALKKEFLKKEPSF